MKTLRARIGAGSGAGPGLGEGTLLGGRASPAHFQPKPRAFPGCGTHHPLPTGSHGLGCSFSRVLGVPCRRAAASGEPVSPCESRPTAHRVTASPVQPFPGCKGTANLRKMWSDGAQRAVKSIQLFSGIHVRGKRASAETEKSREVGENCIYFWVGRKRGQLAVASAWQYCLRSPNQCLPQDEAFSVGCSKEIISASC